MTARTPFLPLTLALALALTAGLTGTVHAASLDVQVVNLPSTQGTVMVALYDKAEGWMKKPLRGAQAVVGADGKAVLRFDDLPDGDYALSVLHDVNGNGKMDFNAMGIPQEAFGFSNKASGSFGPPKFDAARFTVKGDAVHVIDLQ
jgi:uncharacterized protein (DUF2141 family)